MKDLIKNPVKSAYVQVGAVNMHYLEAGEGGIVLFLHGMPTSSFLWRNVMPGLSEHCRCIAPDLIGMGLSDKPDIDYSFHDHINYLESFIQQMQLDDITLVMHGWGSVIGCDYASRYPEKIKALAFYESHLRPLLDWDNLSLPVQQLASLLDDPDVAYKAVVEKNYFLDKLLPASSVDALSNEVLEVYQAPFSTKQSRLVLWRYLHELPLGQPGTPAVKCIERYSTWLTQVSLPKLLLYAVPGFITTVDTVSWAKNNMPNLTLSPLEDVMHLAQETIPDVFAEQLMIWYKTRVQSLVCAQK